MELKSGLVLEVLSRPCYESVAMGKGLLASPNPLLCRTGRLLPSWETWWEGADDTLSTGLAPGWTRGWELLTVIRSWLTDSFHEPPPPQV